jgi:hypothetical protein
MKAAKRAGIVLRVYAVEKNPNALVHIEQMITAEGWGEQVSLVLIIWAGPWQLYAYASLGASLTIVFVVSLYLSGFICSPILTRTPGYATTSASVTQPI